MSAAADADTPVRGPGRPTKGYYLADGTRVPSATTITGYLKSQQLMIWANREGLEGRDINERRDAAATAGSVAHQWVQDYLTGHPMTLFSDVSLDVIKQAEQGFGAFKEWASQVRPRIVESETPLVSEKFRYGGTLDAVAVISDRRTLLDWKTSAGTYGNYIAQLSAYRQLLRERDGDLAPKDAFLLRCGKQFADFHYHRYPSEILDIGWEWFQAMRTLYENDKLLSKVAR